MNGEKEKEPESPCLLGRDPQHNVSCRPGECTNCGWNRFEEARRRQQLEKNGLTLCADGLRRLIIRRKCKEEGEQNEEHAVRSE